MVISKRYYVERCETLERELKELQSSDKSPPEHIRWNLETADALIHASKLLLKDVSDDSDLPELRPSPWQDAAKYENDEVTR